MQAASPCLMTLPLVGHTPAAQVAIWRPLECNGGLLPWQAVIATDNASPTILAPPAAGQLLM